MSIERLKKEGWFDKKEKKDVNLPLKEADFKKLKERKEVIIDSGDQTFLIYIREDADLDDLNEADLIIREIPRAASGSSH